jgi:hypothetical protein
MRICLSPSDSASLTWHIWLYGQGLTPTDHIHHQQRGVVQGCEFEGLALSNGSGFAPTPNAARTTAADSTNILVASWQELRARLKVFIRT